MRILPICRCEVQSVFKDMDFLSGTAEWISYEKLEDMLFVFYPKNFILDMGWDSVRGKYVINVTRDESHVPVLRCSAATEEDIKTLLQEAIKKVDCESRVAKPYYGGFWETEIIEL